MSDKKIWDEENGWTVIDLGMKNGYLEIPGPPKKMERRSCSCGRPVRVRVLEPITKSVKRRIDSDDSWA